MVQVAPAGQYASFAAFREAVRALPLTVERGSPETRPSERGSPERGSPETGSGLRVEYTSLRGDRIEAEYGAEPEVNGAAVDYAGWPLFGGPHLRAERGSGRLELRHGPHRRLLDFNDATITN